MGVAIFALTANNITCAAVGERLYGSTALHSRATLDHGLAGIHGASLQPDKPLNDR